MHEMVKELLRMAMIRRLVSAHHSTPSLQTCILFPNNLTSPSIIHPCFQQVILEAASEWACCFSKHSHSWMQPRVVKVKSRVSFLPRFNRGLTGRVTAFEQHYGKGQTQWIISWNFNPALCTFIKESKLTFTALPEKKERYTSSMVKEENNEEAVRETYKMKGQFKRTQRQQQQTQRKQEEAAKTLDVVS